VERVEGIGGFFFRAKDPEALASWYQEHLGIEPPPTSYDGPVWVQREGPTVLVPFPEQDESPVLGSGGWGINFRVRDLDAIVAQFRGAGIDVEIDRSAGVSERTVRAAGRSGGECDPAVGTRRRCGSLTSRSTLGRS
jgi:hypothetical protein